MKKNFNYKKISIEDLYINPENYRYVDDANDEVNAIIYMFSVPNGDPKKEMCNLSKDIIEDGLNPFEMPIVCFDDDLKKHIVYDGNRRLTCIKLMTQYQDNATILEQIPSVSEIYKMTYDVSDGIQCVVYDEPDDAKHFLNKIHQDLNEGIGRKQWDYYAKMKANSANGNKSKAYAIIELVRNNPNVDPELSKEMTTKKWTSKLERVVGFAKFKEIYNISFGKNGNIVYLDTEVQVLLMMSKLIYDLLHNSATNNFRFKADFENYTGELDTKYKTQVTEVNNSVSESVTENHDDVHSESESKAFDNTTNDINDNNQEVSLAIQENTNGSGTPKPIPRQHATGKEALLLGKNYNYDAYSCLNEKGKEILLELESLNIKEYPVAAVALCRCLLEYTLKLWINEQGGSFNSSSLPSTYNGCLNTLQAKSIIDSKEHSILKAQINKEDFIVLLR